jgi:hypothetical protein
MLRKSPICRPFHSAVPAALMSALVLALLPGATGCSSSRSYAKPAATTTFADSQINMSAQGLTIDGLVEYGNSFPHRYRSQGSGQLTLGARNIEWRSERSQRDFSIRADVLQTATLQCASRPGQNVCLELRLGTVTGLKYAFRDSNWAAGHNEKINEVVNYLKINFPQVTFSEQAVKAID